MSRYSCCTILVWVLLQLICFSPISIKSVKLLEQIQYYKALHAGIEIYFTQNLQSELSQKPVACSNKWKSSDFNRQYVTKKEHLFLYLLRNNVSRMEFKVQVERSVLMLSNLGIQSVSSGEKSIEKSKRALSLQRIGSHIIDLTRTMVICNLKLADISKYSNLLAEQVAKEGMMSISTLRNINSRNSAKMQLFCTVDYDILIFELRHTFISNNQNIEKFCLWILSCNFLTSYFENSVYNFSFKGPWNVNVATFYQNGFEASFIQVLMVSDSHNRNKRNYNISSSHYKHNRNSLKEILKAPNENSFIKEKNSRKNRFLLSVNSESNLDEAKRDMNTSQRARHARNKRAPSTNNQRDSPNGNLYATKVERRRKRKSRRRFAKDLTFAAEAKRAKSSSSQEEEEEEAADAPKRAARISFSTDNEADYRRREIDRQIEADFAEIKDTLRLEKAKAISSAEIAQWPSNNAVKNNRQSVSTQLTIDTQQPEIITGKRVCIAPHCQQVIRHDLPATSPDSNELPPNSRGGDGNIASEQNGIAVAPRKVVDEKIQLGNGNDNDGRKLVGEALIILNKDALPLTIVQKSNDSDVNLKYSVESISLGLDELVKMGKEIMKKELDKVGQNETKRSGAATAGLSRKNCLKYAKGNNETYRGLEDDEGTKLEEQLKELRGMHIQQEKQGFTNGPSKNEMRFAAGDEYTFRNDEAARFNNEYSRGHVRRAKKRCRRKKHKSSTALNTSQKRNNLIQNRIPYHKKTKKSSQNLNNDVSCSDALVSGVTKKSPRIKKNNPYKEYEESGAQEKLLPDRKVVEYSRKKTLRETHSPSKNKEVSGGKIENSKDSHVKLDKSSRRLIPRKARSHKIIKKNMCNRQSSSMNPSVIKHQSQIKKKNKLPQSLSSRKLISVEAGEILRKPFPESKSDTLSRDISNYYDYDDVEMPTISLDQILENRKTITNAPRRKLLSSNSWEYVEGSPISANEESNYDYAEKFYGDQPYEKGALRLHYSQINLRNVTLLASAATARLEEEASRIELAQCHANKSMKTTSANHKTASKTRYPKRTLKSVEQEEQSDYLEKKNSVNNLYLTGDLIGYNYDPEENDEKEKFKREIDENEDPDLARLFANGQEYDINVRGKLHLRLKDPESNVASEKSSKKKRSARPKIGESREKLARAERKFAVDDKRTKRNPDEDSTDVHKEDGYLKSKISNKMRKPLKKISDFFKRKFGGSKKKKFRKKIHAKAKIVRVKPGGQGEDNSQSTFSPPCEQSTTTLKSRRGNCKCALETTTVSEFTTDTTEEATDYITQSTESHESNTENNESNYGVYSKICHCRERSTEMSSVITRSTPQYVTNRPETDYSSTKAQLSHEIVSEESPDTTSVISTNGQTEKTAVIPTNRESSENTPEQQAKMKNVMEILNFIKNLEKLLKDQKVSFRIGDENGGVEIKLEKIYIRPGKNQSIAELKDVSGVDQKEDISDVGDISEVIRQSNVERPILSSQIENIQSLSNQNSKFSSNAAIKNDLEENIFDETSQNIEKQKKSNNAIFETYIEASVPKSSHMDKNARNDKSMPAKQWIDEQRIALDDQSSSYGLGSTSSDRKRKKRRRKKKRLRLRKRNVNETGIAPKKGKALYRPQRRRRRRLSPTNYLRGNLVEDRRSRTDPIKYKVNRKRNLNDQDPRTLVRSKYHSPHVSTMIDAEVRGWTASGNCDGITVLEPHANLLSRPTLPFNFYY